MKSSTTTKSLRIAFATVVGALFAMAAECETVGTSQDRCVTTPEEYSSTLNGVAGDPCNYPVDCNTGLCTPSGGENAVCTPENVENSSACDAVMGPGFAAMTVPVCGSDESLVSTCILENPDAEACGNQDCCEYAQPCTSNEQCCNGHCYDADADGEGSCTANILDACPGDVRVIAPGDEQYVCVPPS